MPEPLYVLIKFAVIFIEAVIFAMSARAIFSWFFEPEGKLFHFLYVLTEPAIMPIRKLFAKMNWFQGLPMDVAYMASFVVLFLIQAFLNSYLM